MTLVLAFIDAEAVWLAADQGKFLGGSVPNSFSSGARKLRVSQDGTVCIAMWGDWVLPGPPSDPSQWIGNWVATRTSGSLLGVAASLKTDLEGLTPGAYSKGGGFFIAGCDGVGPALVELVGSSASTTDTRLRLKSTLLTGTVEPMVRGLFDSWSALSTVALGAGAYGIGVSLASAVAKAVTAMPTRLAGPALAWTHRCVT